MGGAIFNIATKGDVNSIARGGCHENHHATGSTVDTIATRGTVNAITMGGGTKHAKVDTITTICKDNKTKKFFVEIKIDLILNKKLMNHLP